MKLKLYRDRVVSVVRGKDLVGLYVKYPSRVTLVDYKGEEHLGIDTEILLGEFTPFKADKIMKLWNMNLIDNGEVIKL